MSQKQASAERSIIQPSRATPRHLDAPGGFVDVFRVSGGNMNDAMRNAADLDALRGAMAARDLLGSGFGTGELPTGSDGFGRERIGATPDNGPMMGRQERLGTARHPPIGSKALPGVTGINQAQLTPPIRHMERQPWKAVAIQILEAGVFPIQQYPPQPKTGETRPRHYHRHFSSEDGGVSTTTTTITKTTPFRRD